MSLPTDNKTNPLHGLNVAQQCNYINQKQADIDPWLLFSLNPHAYTDQEVKKSYRLFSLQFHPDRTLGIEHAAVAFNIVTQIKEYLLWKLHPETTETSMLNNPFYKRYEVIPSPPSPCPEENAEAAFAWHDWFPNLNLSFDKLANELRSYPFPPKERAKELIRQIKNLILHDKSLLNREFNPNGPNKKILNVAVGFNHPEFALWLLEQGAAPFLGAKPYTDTIDPKLIAISCEEDDYLEILRYIKKIYGEAVFYEKDTNRKTIPKWDYFARSIKWSSPKVLNFLFYEIGYQKHIQGHFFDEDWSLSHTSVQKTAVTKILLEYNLIKDLTAALYWAASRGLTEIVRLLLNKNPSFNIATLLTKHWYGLPDNAEGLFDLLLETFETQKDISPTDLEKIFITVTNQKMMPVVLKRLLALELPAETLPEDFSQLSAKRRDEIIYYTFWELANQHKAEALKKLLAITSTPITQTPFLFDLLSLMFKSDAADYEPVVTVLVEYVGASLTKRLQEPAESYNTISYYNTLHYLCDYGFVKPAMRWVEHMVAAGCNLDEVCQKQKRETPEALLSIYRYTALHLAIDKGYQELAIKLIQSGADYRKKAEIREASYTLSIFPYLRHLEKMPIQMAKEGKQLKVLRTIQMQMLNEYIAQRQKEDEYLSHITLFGHTFVRFGFFNKSTKLEAAETYRKALLQGEHSTPLPQLHKGPLTQGRLGEIVSLVDGVDEAKESSTSHAFKI